MRGHWPKALAAISAARPPALRINLAVGKRICARSRPTLRPASIPKRFPRSMIHLDEDRASIFHVCARNERSFATAAAGLRLISLRWERGSRSNRRWRDYERIIEIRID